MSVDIDRGPPPVHFGAHLIEYQIDRIPNVDSITQYHR
jgi:hypothetical protein